MEKELKNEIKKVGVLTSGGDAPGMNAAIRAVTRMALRNNIQVIGIRKGYNGLINGDINELRSRDVTNIIDAGGTILHTARSKEMVTKEGQEKAAKIYEILGLDALIIIGGDGSFRGGEKLSKLGVNVIGIPATIDLDLGCTEYTIGFDTAVNTGTDAIGKLRDTSSSHERCSVVEVMGRDAGYIAIWCAVSGGADEVIIPEKNDDEEKLHSSIIEKILHNRSEGKKHNLVVVAEGIGGTQKLADDIQKITGIQSRATILGHLQRGGTPTAIDRLHASSMGCIAIKTILDGEMNKVIAFNKGRYEVIDISKALEMKKSYDEDMYNMVRILSI